MYGEIDPLLERFQRDVERALQERADGWRGPAPLRDAMAYALLGAGKRLRPVLCLAAASACGGRVESALPLALALEHLHAYSLVHDDLPAMDNDLLRRGLPTVHVRYGEALAILAGDALHDEAYRAALDAKDLHPELRCAALEEIQAAAGQRGMVGGQVLDIEGVARDVPAFREMHSLKTGALFRAALVLGAISAGMSLAQREAMAVFGDAFGALFQLVDDMEDALEASEHQQRAEEEVNLVLLLGWAEAEVELRRQQQVAEDALVRLALCDGLLNKLLAWLCRRGLAHCSRARG